MWELLWTFILVLSHDWVIEFPALLALLYGGGEEEEEAN